jgi:putative FmdB family regulatory protein
MPLYEYYCQPCNGVFELLRPTREANLEQPCPQCDEDSRRIVSKEFAAFTFRDGFPRRIPDDGSYWHLGKKVSKPLTGTIEGMQHPELKKKPDYEKPSLEEIQQFEFRQQVRRELDDHHGARMINETVEKQDRYFRNRLRKTRGTPQEEQAKRQFIQREREESRKHAHKLEREAGGGKQT